MGTAARLSPLLGRSSTRTGWSRRTGNACRLPGCARCKEPRLQAGSGSCFSYATRLRGGGVALWGPPAWPRQFKQVVLSGLARGAQELTGLPRAISLLSEPVNSPKQEVRSCQCCMLLCSPQADAIGIVVANWLSPRGHGPSRAWRAGFGPGPSRRAGRPVEGPAGMAPPRPRRRGRRRPASRRLAAGPELDYG